MPLREFRGMTIAQLNAIDRDAFVDAVGFAFEYSPWIAKMAWDLRPFAGTDELFAAMLAVLDASPTDHKVGLIEAHPDLAGRVAREGRLTTASTDEQASAGLDELTDDERTHFDQLNTAYRARFEFPFIICARENDKHSILTAMAQRCANDRDTEIATALREIAKIARLRLNDAIKD